MFRTIQRCLRVPLGVVDIPQVEYHWPKLLNDFVRQYCPNVIFIPHWPCPFITDSNLLVKSDNCFTVSVVLYLVTTHTPCGIHWPTRVEVVVLIQLGEIALFLKNIHKLGQTSRSTGRPSAMGFDFNQEQKISIFPTVTDSLWCIKPLTNGYDGFFSSGLNKPGYEAHHLPPWCNCFLPNRGEDFCRSQF